MRITHLPAAHDGSGGDGHGSEQTKDVDMSRILKYVSKRELERFENAEFKAEAEAEAAAQRAEAEELARRRLRKNARVPRMGRGSRMLSGLGLDPEAPMRRGRPRGRGRGRWRGRGVRTELGSGLGMESEDAQPLEAPHHEGEDLQRIIAETEDEDEEEDESEEDLPRLKQPSPDLVRSSFVVNSALPVSPVAAYRSLAKPPQLRQDITDVDEEEEEEEEERDEEDRTSMSGAAAQLHFERHSHERHFLDSDEESVEDRHRHRAKRRRTESTSSSRPRAPATASSSKQLLSLAHSMSKKLVHDSPEPELGSESKSEESSDDAIPAHPPSHGADADADADAMEVEPSHQNGHDEDEGDESDVEEYVVEAILAHSYGGDKKYYLVKWEGCEDSSDWLPEEDLAGASELVAAYEERLQRWKGKGVVR